MSEREAGIYWVTVTDPRGSDVRLLKWNGASFHVIGDRSERYYEGPGVVCGPRIPSPEELQAAAEREAGLVQALKRAAVFMSYARYLLDAEHNDFEQFPCQECADKEIAKVDAAIGAQPSEPT